jgi:hypothetical protein
MTMSRRNIPQVEVFLRHFVDASVASLYLIWKIERRLPNVASRLQLGDDRRPRERHLTAREKEWKSGFGLRVE